MNYFACIKGILIVSALLFSAASSSWEYISKEEIAKRGDEAWTNQAWDHYLTDFNRWPFAYWAEHIHINRNAWIERPHNIARLLLTGMPNTHISLIGIYQPRDWITPRRKGEWQSADSHYNNIRPEFLATMKNIPALNQLIAKINEGQQKSPSKEVWFPAFLQELENLLIENVAVFSVYRNAMNEMIANYPLERSD